MPPKLKNYFLFFFIQLILLPKVVSQHTQTFEITKKRVSEAYFTKPESVKKDAILLQQLAKTNKEKEIALKYLGYIYDLTNNIDSAKIYLERRLAFNKEYFKNTTLHYDAIIAYVNWGINHLDNEKLMAELTDGLSQCNTTTNKQEKGLMFLLLGDIFLKNKDLDKANEYFDKSFELITGKYVASDYFYRKSEVAILRPNYEEAKSFLLKGVESLKGESVYIYPSYLNKLGYVSIMLDDLTSAKKYLTEALHYQKNNDFKNALAETYLYLSLLSKLKRDPSEKEYLDWSNHFNKDNLFLQSKIYLAYKDYFSRNSNPKKEHEYFLKYNSINDSIFSSEKAKIRINLETRYQLKERQKEIKFQKEIISKSEKIKNLYAAILILLGLFLLVVIILFFIKINSHKKNRLQEKRIHEEQLSTMLEKQKTALIKEQIKAKIEERKRLSLELHDGLANEISALKLTLTNNNDKCINNVLLKIDTIYNQVRDLSHGLDPNSITEIEFYQLAEKIFETIEKHGIKVEKHLFISERIDQLNDSILLNIYRILQEAISNIIKHSQANKVHIEILEHENYLMINISDNGKGLNNKNYSGIGLENIKTRVSNLKGTILLKSNDGLSIEIKIPLTPENPY